MAEDTQLERIYQALNDFSKEQVEQGKILVRVEENQKNTSNILASHLEYSVRRTAEVDDKLGEHDSFIQRARGIAWLLGIMWTGLLAWLGYRGR